LNKLLKLSKVDLDPNPASFVEVLVPHIRKLCRVPSSYWEQSVWTSL